MEEFLRRAATGPAGLVIEGEAGIGKTTSWLQICDQAAAEGFRVLSARGSPSEVSLAFSALADLAATAQPADLDQLPTVQQQALTRILRRGGEGEGSGPATDEWAAAAAFRALVEIWAKDAPVLIAVDDVQWLDKASASAIQFAALRVTGRVGFMVTARTGDPDSVDTLSWLRMASPAAVNRKRMLPLTFDGLHALLSARLGRALPRPTMLRIQEISGGNPLYALELARAALDGADLGSQLPHTLAALVQGRVDGLEAETAGLLLTAACAADPSVELLAAVTGHTEPRVAAVLECGDAATLVTITGNRVRFTHPLLAAGVYNNAEPNLRRETHRRLADCVTEPELRVRHLALAATSGDSDTLAALDAAAFAVREHSGPAAATELVELAISLGGDTPLRRMSAARYQFESGANASARRHLEGVVEKLPPGVLRGMARMLRGAVDGQDGNLPAAVDNLKAALAEVESVPAMQLQCLVMLAPAVGVNADFTAAAEYGSRAVELADEVSDPMLGSQALATHAQFVLGCGMGRDKELERRAVALQGTVTTALHVNTRADVIVAINDSYDGKLAEAKQALLAIRAQCDAVGQEVDVFLCDQFLAQAYRWSGDYLGSAAAVKRLQQSAERTGGDFSKIYTLVRRAEVTAYAGDVVSSESAAAAAIALGESLGMRYPAIQARTSLGFLHVSQLDYRAALKALGPLLAGFEPKRGTEISVGAWLPDAIEALVALDRVDDALNLVGALQDNGTRLERDWMLAIGARGQALCLAAQGDLAAAEEAAVAALEDHELMQMQFELARTQLVLGQIQRRRRHRQQAEQTLRQALRAFETLGTPLWAQRAQAELARLTPAGAGGDLTAAEERVARRAAAGLSNKEIAAELFMALKTVETNLSSVYRKLGIRSRAQLHGKLL